MRRHGTAPAAALCCVLQLACSGGTGGGNDGGGAGGSGGATAGTGGGTGGSGGGTGGGGGSGGGVEPPPAGNPVFVAVGYGAHRTRSRNGRNWENHQIVDPNGGDDANLLRGVGWGNGVFVAVGNQVLTSRDGVTWTKSGYNPQSFLADAAYAGGTWVVAGGNGLRARSMNDGAAWTNQTPYYEGHFRGIAAGNGRFVAVGHTYGGLGTVGLTSATRDGVTWTAPRTGGRSFSWVAFGNGVFVAVGAGGRIAVSADGEAWEELTLGGEERGHVAFANGEFLIPDGSGLARSTDGKRWTHADGTRLDVYAFGGGNYAATAYPGIMYHATDPTRFMRTETMGPSLTDMVVGFVP